MKLKFLVATLATIFLASAARADLNTWTHISHDGGGSGDVQGDITGVGEVTILEEMGVGDAWNGGDQITFLYDGGRQNESFSAQVRVVSQTEAVEGRWGKGGILARNSLDGNSANVMAQVAAGNGSQADPPSSGGDHSPVPIRLAGRTGNNGQGGFEIGTPIPNNVFPETTDIPSPANVVWLQLNWAKSSNSYWAGVADDVSGAPGPWSLSPIQTSVPAPDAEGLYLGLGYSAHNSLQPSGDLHGVTFDNYAVGAIVGRALEVDGDLELNGELADIVRGPDIIEPGLGQEWIDGNFRNNPEGLETATAFNVDPFTTDPTWWSGSQTAAGVPKYPNHPALSGSKWEGSGNVDNYAVRLKGQVFFAENGDYLMRDGIDDYTMVRIDLDGDGQFTGDLLPAPGESNGSNDEVVIHDDAWNNFNGEGGGLGTPDEEAFFSVENINAGGEWRDIEVWTGEAGGGDGGVLYMTRDSSPEADNWPSAGFGGAAQAEYMMGNDILRAVLPGEILSGTSTAALDEGFNYIVEVSSEILRSDLISVRDPGGEIVTRLDISGVSVQVVENGELLAGDEWVIFGADELLGEDGVNLIFDDPSQWDVSGLSQDGLGGHRIRYTGGFIPGDCNGDGVVDAGDLACVSTIEERDTVLATIPSLPGDLDGNGDVAFPDFLVLSANFGQDLPSYTDGNIDLEGAVAFPDFLILSANFGQVPAGGATASAVPEPSSLALFGLGGLLLGLLRRRR